MSIESLRRTYLMGTLNFDELAACPIEQFTRWFEQLKQEKVPEWFEINAMTLSTATATGVVSGRIVLLKAYDRSGFTFFTNYLSHKSQQLAENHRAALTFFWPMLERQVRIEGSVTKTDAATSDSYFQARPESSQLGAWASPQSGELANDECLESRLSEWKQKFGEKIPRPKHWGGYRLAPDRFEFWQGKPSRLHDRFCYTLANQAWGIKRLAP